MSRVHFNVRFLLFPSTSLRNTASFPVSLAWCIDYLSLGQDTCPNQLNEGFTLAQFKGTVYIVKKVWGL